MINKLIIILNYFYHHKVFVYTRGDGNLFTTDSSQLMFSYRLVAVLCNTIHWEVETHVGDIFFQFICRLDTISMFSKLKYVREFSFCFIQFKFVT